jgi:hypothetical protein
MRGGAARVARGRAAVGRWAISPIRKCFRNDARLATGDPISPGSRNPLSLVTAMLPVTFGTQVAVAMTLTELAATWQT